MTFDDATIDLPCPLCGEIMARENDYRLVEFDCSKCGLIIESFWNVKDELGWGAFIRGGGLPTLVSWVASLDECCRAIKLQAFQ